MSRARTRKILVLKSTQAAFTLLEIVVALAVMAVAVSIIVTLYQASAMYAAQSREIRTAMVLAEERLQDIRINSSSYEWPTLTPEKPAEIKPVSGVYSVEPPKSLPPEPSAGLRERNMYEGFTWHAYAKLGQPNSEIVELTVIVEWQSRGKNRSFSLTTYTPKVRSGGTV